MATEVTPRYCGRCGERLEVIRSDRGYDTNTGAPKFAYWLSCPKAERPDTPYRPYTMGSVAYTNPDGSKFENEDPYSYSYNTYLDCTPWPKPIVREEVGP
jgi:hypothetical protein